jgi:hypothetical protein
VTDVKSANAIVETHGKLRQRRKRHPQQCVDLFPRQVGPDAKAGFNWISEERFTEPRVRNQPTQCSLNTALTHGSTFVSVLST